MMVQLLVAITILMETLVSGLDVCQTYRSCYGDTISSDTLSCRGYQSCYEADITASDDVYCWSSLSCYYAEIDVTDTVKIDGQQGARNSDIQADTVYASGEQGAYDADITATTVYGYAYHSLYLADISATVVYGDAYRTLRAATLQPEDTELTVYFRSYQAGYETDIICNDGETCDVYCEQAYACYNVTIYCYDGADCRHYYNSCQNPGTDYFVKVYSSTSGKFTDVDIRRIYEERKERRIPEEEEPVPIDDPVPTIPNNYLSLSTAQITLLCLLLNALLVLASIGLCAYNVSHSKKKYNQIQKEDYN